MIHSIPLTIHSLHHRHLFTNLSHQPLHSLVLIAETAEIDAIKPDACTATNKWYECCGDPTVQPSIPKC
jgi:hypothetical protein